MMLAPLLAPVLDRGRQSPAWGGSAGAV